MTDYNSDQGRELRRARLTVVRPFAAKTHMPRAAFITEYKDPHILRRVAMTEDEETDRIMFCPACVQTMEGDDEFVEAHKLHVGYEEDPLRNYPALLAEVHKLADAAGEVEWVVAIDSTIARVHQHGATLTRGTGGRIESQESVVVGAA